MKIPCNDRLETEDRARMNGGGWDRAGVAHTSLLSSLLSPPPLHGIRFIITVKILH